MLTNEDILMISNLLDAKLDAQSKIMDEKNQYLKDELCSEMQNLRSEFRGEMQNSKSELRGEMQNVRSELCSEMQNSKSELCGEMQNLRKDLHEEINHMKCEISDLKNGLQNLGDEVGSIKILLEDDIIPRLCTIESCYVDTYRRYSMGVVEIEKVRTDVDILKNVVKEHSEKLKKVQ